MRVTGVQTCDRQIYEFGQYVQLHIQEKVKNTMKSRTIGAIGMGPGEIRGRYN